MSNYKRIYDWYEDDCVKYTQSYKHPKIPEKYKYCNYKKKHKLKKFYTYNHALGAYSYANKSWLQPFHKPDFIIIFKCDKCQMYHIMNIATYKKLLKYDR